MSYGILLWGNAAGIWSIFILEKRSIRAIYNISPEDFLRQKFKEINILTVVSQYIFENVMYIKKNFNHFTKIDVWRNINTSNRLT